MTGTKACQETLVKSIFGVEMHIQGVSSKMGLKIASTELET